MSCPVCFSASDPAITESLNAGIFVLLGVTGVVLAGIARFVFALVRRAGNPVDSGRYISTASPLKIDPKR